MQDKDYVKIFDTTLRDGEQSPGATMTAAQKMQIAKVLARLGVDVIEAGFPAASPDDLEAVKYIAARVGNSDASDLPKDRQPPVICGLARAKEADIDKTWQAVGGARFPRIHTFLATSPIHMQEKLRMTAQEVVAKVDSMVRYAHHMCQDVEFSAEDAGRSDPVFLYEVLQTAIESGATTINIPDTVGYNLPQEFGALIAGIMEHVPGIADVTLSVHCHNDLGFATANTLSGIMAGARQVEVAVNGIGERAGNAALEEITMALHTRRAVLGLTTGIDATHLSRASRLVSSCTGIVVQPNKAVVGANAFAHEAGIHQDGMLKHAETYEIMRPETVGAGETQLVLGKHSGRHAVKVRLMGLGYTLSDDDLAKTFVRFKNLADKKKNITDADLEAVACDELHQPMEFFHLDAVQVACGSQGMPTATVRLIDPSGEKVLTACVGTGPVDAVYRAIDELTGVEVKLLDYSVQSVTAGIDALGEVTVRLGDKRVAPLSSASTPSPAGVARVHLGHGANTDIVVASAKAYLAAINKLLRLNQTTKNQKSTVSSSTQHNREMLSSS